MPRTIQPAPGVVARHLAKVPAFTGLAAADLDLLAEPAILRLYERGEVLFRAGDPAVELHCVVRGTVRVLRGQPDGREKVIHLFSAPASMAEVPVLMGGHYPATADCNDPCTLVSLPRRALLAAVARDPEFPLHLMAALFERLQELTRSLASHGQKSAVARVGSFLLGLSHGQPEVSLPAAKKDIASFLGLQPESFSRALAVLRAEGSIEVSDQDVIIRDREKLEAVLERIERGG